MSKPRLPRGWTTERLNEVAEINPPNPEVRPDDDTLVSFVPMAAVQAMGRGIDTSEVRPWRMVRKGYKRFQDGDVLFAKITPCMENGKLAVATGLRNGVGAGSTEFPRAASVRSHSPRPVGVLHAPGRLSGGRAVEDDRHRRPIACPAAVPRSADVAGSAAAAAEAHRRDDRFLLHTPRPRYRDSGAGAAEPEAVPRLNPQGGG